MGNKYYFLDVFTLPYLFQLLFLIDKYFIIWVQRHILSLLGMVRLLFNTVVQILFRCRNYLKYLPSVSSGFLDLLDLVLGLPGSWSSGFLFGAI